MNVNVQRDINEGGRERGSLKERAYRSMREERHEVCGRQKRVSRGARERSEERRVGKECVP